MSGFTVTTDEDLDAVRAMFDDAQRALAAGSKDAVRRAVVAGEKEAKASHRFRNQTGALEASTKGRVTKETADGAEGVVEATAPHAVFVHGGTQPHEIRAKRAGALRWEDAAGVHLAQRVNHPGTDPDPFIDDAAPAVEAELERACEDACERAAQALGA